MKIARLASLGMLAIAMIGCNRSERLPVAGRIAVGGKPVDRGLVVFQPTERAEKPVGAGIRDGRFSTEVGRGLRPENTR
jgi:hypothetical protein